MDSDDKTFSCESSAIPLLDTMVRNVSSLQLVGSNSKYVVISGNLLLDRMLRVTEDADVSIVPLNCTPQVWRTARGIKMKS